MLTKSICCGPGLRIFCDSCNPLLFCCQVGPAQIFRSSRLHTQKVVKTIVKPSEEGEAVGQAAESHRVEIFWIDARHKATRCW